MSCQHSLRTCPSCEVATKEADRKWRIHEAFVDTARVFGARARIEIAAGDAESAAFFTRLAVQADRQAEESL